MKQVDEMPQEGQFISVWQFNDKIWSETLCYKGKDLYLYDHYDNIYKKCEFTPMDYKGIGVKFFV